MVSNIMETLMIICFGLSWPINIVRAWKSKTAKSISIVFYYLIWIGYIFAIIGKLAMIIDNAPLPWYETVKWYVMFFYIVNVIMVTIGILIYYRNKEYDTGKKFYVSEGVCRHERIKQQNCTL